MFGNITAVVGVGAGFAALDCLTPTSVPTGQVGREIQIEELDNEQRTVWCIGGGTGTDCQDLVPARRVKRATLVMRTLALVIAFTLWRMGETELYTHAQPRVVRLGAGRSASARAEYLR